MSVPTLPYVGGIIFYIDSTADGTYTFYNDLGAQVSAPSVGTDCTGWTYSVSGATKDKYYVVYNHLYSNVSWGGFGSQIGANGTAIGTGRGNTELAIGSTADVSGSIWETIRTMRANELGGCNDWFVPSRDELATFMSAGTMLIRYDMYWFESYVCSSSEDNGENAYMYNYKESGIIPTTKLAGSNVFGIRAF